jgi:hypothetical protein
MLYASVPRNPQPATRLDKDRGMLKFEKTKDPEAISSFHADCLNKYVKQFRLHIQFSIVNGQFPDKSGLTLR